VSPLYGFAFSAKALASLKEIPAKFRKQIVTKAESLLADPTPQGSKQLQNMVDGSDPVHRIRSGDYRILYVIRENPNQIVVLDVGHRKDVYR
jgi:mRNA interferase RelE/StbE